MSDYEDIIQGFGLKCKRILELFYKDAQINDVEVTLLLSVATSGLTIPMERLNPSHPSGDAQKFVAAKKAYDDLKRTNFIGSILWNYADAASWKYIPEIVSVEGSPGTWDQLNTAAPIPGNFKINQLLRHLRNSLAHGNIFTTPYKENIHTIIFLSRIDQTSKGEVAVQGKLIYKDDRPTSFQVQEIKFDPPNQSHKYALLAVSPDDFYKSLEGWFCFLEGLKLDEAVV
jgi:hypothetical protein